MPILLLLACTTSETASSKPVTVPTPAETIAEAEPEPSPSVATPAEPGAVDPIEAFTTVPPAVGALYELSLASDRSTFTADPAPIRRETAARSAGFKTEDTKRGGKRVQLEGGPIATARWRRLPLKALITDAEQASRATAAGFALDRERDVLELRTEPGGEPTTFAFSEDAAQRGLLGICSEVTVVDFGAPAPQIAVRKPVIYAYPDRPRELTIRVDPAGGLTVAHPAPSADGWQVRAHPDGTLETEGRSHRYLFWEAETPSLPLDRRRAHSVPREEVAAFLDDVCDAYALTDAECGDFVTYWLPEMIRHPHVLVDFPLAAYERFAPLTVEPSPDTVIRLFMVFEGRPTSDPTEPKPLPRHERRGFTVVEWGGAELPGAGR